MKFVQPKISCEEAKRILGRRREFLFRRKCEMKKVELVYIPYYVHEVSLALKGGESEMLVCTDGICSDFCFFDSKQLDFSDEALGEVFDFLASPEEAKRVCLENLRWHLVRQGLRSKVSASVTGVREAEKVAYPYWIGYFMRTRGHDFRALDAVTGEIQGGRMREVFTRAFLRRSMDDTSAVAARKGGLTVAAFDR